MKIKYEATIKDCSECEIYCRNVFGDWSCNKDGIVEIKKLIGKSSAVETIHPCELRPCPLEVKE